MTSHGSQHIGRPSEAGPDRGGARPVSKAEYQALLARGISAASANDLPRARMLLRAASERDPNGIDAWLWLAQTAETPTDALSYLRRALEIAPDHARACSAFQQLLLREGVAAAKALAKDRARALLRELCGFAPRDERAWLWRASVAERYEEAVECLTRVLDIHPGHAQAQAALERMRQRGATRGAHPAPAASAHSRTAAVSIPPRPSAPPSTAGVSEPRLARQPIEGDQPSANTIRTTGVLGQGSNRSGLQSDVTGGNPRGTPPAWRRGVDRTGVPGQTNSAPGALGPLAGLVPPAPAPVRLRDVPTVPATPSPAGYPSPGAASTDPPSPACSQQASDAPADPRGADDAPALRVVEGSVVPAPQAAATSLPAAEPLQHSAEIDQEAASTEPAPGTVLVVDDSPTVLKVVGFALKKHGLDVVTASSGPEALALLTSLMPDLVLLDVNMPDMDGYQVCRAIRRDGRTARIPVVMLSGKDGFFDKIRGRMAGAVEYITKPFEPGELMAMLGKYFPVRLGSDERAPAAPEPSLWSGRVLGRNA